MREEDYVRAYVPAKSPKAAPATVPVVQAPVMAYAAPADFVAVPTAYAMPNYPVPVHAQHAQTHASASARVHSTSTKVSSRENEKPAEKASKVWVGRTKKQVDEDNIKIAINEGIYEPNEVVPKDAKPDQLFWVIANDGTNTLRTFKTIDGGHLGGGTWKIDPRYGNAYFVLAKEGKKK